MLRDGSLLPWHSQALRFLALLYAALGLVFFLAPGWSALQFPWRVEPFVAMTMGGWCIGNAYFAWEAARLARWSTAAYLHVYLWVFGLGQVLVLCLYRGVIRWDGILTWPYIVTLALNAILAIVGIVSLMRARPTGAREGDRMSWFERIVAIGFVLFVGVLAWRGAVLSAGGLGTEGGIFPTKLSLFSVRGFAAFYAALTLAALPAIWSSRNAATRTFVRAGLWLLIPILAAALWHLNLFDFQNRPGGYLYIGAYVLALVLSMVYGVWLRGRATSA
jgi:hypothetical protein